MTTHLPSTKQVRRLTIRRKLKTALDLMVWGDKENVPHEWDAAARAVNFNVAAMRKALERPHVRAYLNAQRTYCRDAIAAKNPRRLAQLRDQDENRGAAVKAIQVMEGFGAEDHGRAPGGTLTLPGLTIQIINPPPALTPARHGVTIDVDPMPTRQRVERDDEP